MGFLRPRGHEARVSGSPGLCKLFLLLITQTFLATATIAACATGVPCSECCDASRNACEQLSGCDTSVTSLSVETLPTGPPRGTFASYYVNCVRDCETGTGARAKDFRKVPGVPQFCEAVCDHVIEPCLKDDVCFVSFGAFMKNGGQTTDGLQDTGDPGSRLLLANALQCFSNCKNTGCPFLETQGSPCSSQDCGSMFLEFSLTTSCCQRIQEYCLSNTADAACCDHQYLECDRPDFCPDPLSLTQAAQMPSFSCGFQCHDALNSCTDQTSNTQCGLILTDLHDIDTNPILPLGADRNAAADYFAACQADCASTVDSRSDFLNLCEHGSACDAAERSCLLDDLCFFTMPYIEVSPLADLLNVDVQSSVDLISDLHSCYAANPCLGCSGPADDSTCGCEAAKQACFSDNGCLSAVETDFGTIATSSSRTLLADYHLKCCLNCTTDRAAFIPEDQFDDSQCLATCQPQLDACVADDECFVSLPYFRQSLNTDVFLFASASSALLEDFFACYHNACPESILCKGPGQGDSACQQACNTDLTACLSDDGCAKSDTKIPTGESRTLFTNMVASCCAKCVTGDINLRLLKGAPDIHTDGTTGKCHDACKDDLLACAAENDCLASLRFFERQFEDGYALDGDSGLLLTTATDCVNSQCCPYNISNPGQPCYSKCAFKGSFSDADCCQASSAYCHSIDPETDSKCCELPDTCGLDSPCGDCPFFDNITTSPCFTCQNDFESVECCQEDIMPHCQAVSDPGCRSESVKTGCLCPFNVSTAATSPCGFTECDFSGFAAVSSSCCDRVVSHCAAETDSGCDETMVQPCFSDLTTTNSITCGGEFSVTLSFNRLFDVEFRSQEDVALFRQAVIDGVVSVGVPSTDIICVQVLEASNGHILSVVDLSNADTRNLLVTETDNNRVNVRFRGEVLPAANNNAAESKAKPDFIPYIVAGAAVMMLVLAVLMVIRKRKRDQEEVALPPDAMELATDYLEVDIPDPKKPFKRRSSREREAELRALLSGNDMLATKKDTLQRQREALLQSISTKLAPAEAPPPSFKGFAEIHIATYQNNVERLHDLMQTVTLSQPPSPYSGISAASPQHSETTSDAAMTISDRDMSPPMTEDDLRMVIDFSEPVLQAESLHMDMFALSPASATSTSSASTDSSAAQSAIAQTLALKKLLNLKDDIVGNTPIIWATSCGNKQALDYLLNSGANANGTNNEGQTALHVACILGSDATIIDSLLKAGASQAVVDNENMTPMAYACSGGSREILARLLAHNRSWWDLAGESPLICATKLGRAVVVSQLLQSPAPDLAINAQDARDMTALHIAAGVGDLNCVQAIVALASDTARLVPDGRGNNPLHLAAREGHTTVVAELMKLPRIDLSPNTTGETPLHLAIREGHISVLATILEGGRKEVKDLWPKNQTIVEMAKIHNFKDAEPLVVYARGEMRFDCMQLVEAFEITHNLQSQG